DFVQVGDFLRGELRHQSGVASLRDARRFPEVDARDGVGLLGGGELVEDGLLAEGVLVEDDREVHAWLDFGVHRQQLFLPQVTNIDVAADVQVDVAGTGGGGRGGWRGGGRGGRLGGGLRRRRGGRRAGRGRRGRRGRGAARGQQRGHAHGQGALAG